MKRMSFQACCLGLVWMLQSVGMAQTVLCENNIPASNPDAVYTDHGNGTVTDTRTGLMWKQCVEGLSGEECQTGSAQLFTWYDALAQAEVSTFAGYTDWRLPNIKELTGLVEDCRINPAININRFPNTPLFYTQNITNTVIYQWSGSPVTNLSLSAWVVHFGPGVVYRTLRGFHPHAARLVRGGQ